MRERRLQPRWTLQCSATLDTPDHISHPVQVRDLSFGGAGLINGPFQPREEAVARLRVPTPSGEHQLYVRIVHDQGGSKRRYGVEFCGLASQISKTVVAMIRELGIEI